MTSWISSLSLLLGRLTSNDAVDHVVDQRKVEALQSGGLCSARLDGMFHDAVDLTCHPRKCWKGIGQNCSKA